MHTILSRDPRRFISKSVLIGSFFLLWFNCLTANAQSFRDYDDMPGNGIGLNVALDVPVGNLQYTYKPAINYHLNYYRFFEHATGTFGIGYRTYQPKQDVFYYAVNDNDYGTISYSDLRSIIGYLGAAYNIDITDVFKVYGGFNLGCYITKFNVRSKDAFVDSYQQIGGEQQVYFAPKLGVSLDIGDYLQLNVQGAYNIFAPTGKKQWNDRVGTMYSSYTIGSGLTFKF